MKLTVVSLILAIVLSLQLLPNKKIGFQQSASQASTSALDVLSINLLSSNTNFEKLNTLVESLDPDILVLIEFTSFWKQHIDFEKYPYHIQTIQKDHVGMGLYSKLPLNKKESLYFTGSRFPYIHAEVILNETPLNILAAHFENPVGAKASKLRNFQMEKSAAFLNTIQTPKLLIGDFNCTPYSYAFKSLIDSVDLYDSRSKWTIGSSWPTYFFPLMIPIDHALVSEEIIVTERRVIHLVGSDHKALFVKIGID